MEDHWKTLSSCQTPLNLGSEATSLHCLPIGLISPRSHWAMNHHRYRSWHKSLIWRLSDDQSDGIPWQLSPCRWSCHSWYTLDISNERWILEHWTHHHRHISMEEGTLPLIWASSCRQCRHAPWTSWSRRPRHRWSRMWPHSSCLCTCRSSLTPLAVRW